MYTSIQDRAPLLSSSAGQTNAMMMTMQTERNHDSEVTTNSNSKLSSGIFMSSTISSTSSSSASSSISKPPMYTKLHDQIDS